MKTISVTMMQTPRCRTYMHAAIPIPTRRTHKPPLIHSRAPAHAGDIVHSSTLDTMPKIPAL